MDHVDCIAIGAGVVGLAVARALAQAGREVVVLESESGIGTMTSSRNSEVIHAGIYYPEGSLKARLCVAGKLALYELCESHGVPYRRCGKLIVATQPQQEEALERLRVLGVANGVDDLRWVTAQEAHDLEPPLKCDSALLSLSTGIVDSHSFMIALQGDAEAHGAMVAFQSPVLGGEITSRGIVVTVGGEETSRLLSTTVVNCAGLHAQHVAASIEGFPKEWIPPAYYAKGNYFTVSGRTGFSRLIYPIPEPGGLGVHLTLDLGGQARFGPDVEWVTELNYEVDPRRAESFYSEIRKYWPALPDGALHPDYSGIRPKLVGPGEPAADFRIDGTASHGVPGLINLFGIESPGLTAAIAIGDYVLDLSRA